MEENDYDDYGSPDGPTFVDGYAIYFSLGVIVEMLLAHIYSTRRQQECQCICLISVNIYMWRHQMLMPTIQ